VTTTASLDHIRRLRRDGELVVIDGGMGSELEAQGASMDHDAWSGLINLADPALVRRVHDDYVRAGADVLITNTFMSGSGPLERARAGESFAAANRNAVRAAREAATDAGRPIVIAGSVSVTQLGAPETAPASGGEERRRLRDGYARQIEVLAQEGVDLIALEMVDHPRYAEPAVEAALSCGLPVWLGLCVHADERDRGDSAPRRPSPTSTARWRASRRATRLTPCASCTPTSMTSMRPSPSWARLGPALWASIRTTACGSGRAGGSSTCPRSALPSSRAAGVPREWA
jgi:hypothetical protein